MVGVLFVASRGVVERVIVCVDVVLPAPASYSSSQEMEEIRSLVNVNGNENT